MPCNKSNDDLDAAEWSRIEDACRAHSHIAPDENLQELIAADEHAVASRGITFEQLRDFFSKLKYHFWNALACDLSDEESQQVEMFLDDSVCFSNDRVRHWCLQGDEKKRIFCSSSAKANNRLTVLYYAWGGAEKCQFQAVNDTYYGYQYGSLDWIFIKDGKVMHIGDLLFHSIAEHHFFQSSKSPYRVDPVELIEFFNIKPDVVYKPILREVRIWQFSSSALARMDYYGIDLNKCKKEVRDNLVAWYDESHAVIDYIKDIQDPEKTKLFLNEMKVQAWFPEAGRREKYNLEIKTEATEEELASTV
jgi:hypothetical protein